MDDIHYFLHWSLFLLRLEKKLKSIEGDGEMKQKPRFSPRAKIVSILILTPITVVIVLFTISFYLQHHPATILKKSADTITGSIMDIHDRHLDPHIPEEFIPIYLAAEEEYGVPWTLLAAHHRIETKFSTMDPLFSPAGAEGHMQFMPCTFVGWGYPGCDGLGKGEIPEEDKTDPAVIAKYGGYGVDANGDGRANPYDIEDAIFSAANYLADSGAADGQIEQAILEYNRSEKYVKDVLFYYNKYEETKDQFERYFARK